MDMRASLTLDHIRALEAVWRTGSFSLAGRNLFVSQPAVSQRIHQLELVLGQPVLHRGQGQSPTLTPAGEAVVQLACKLHHLFDEFFEDIDKLSLASDGVEHLTVACGPGSARYVLPQVILKLSKDRPGVRIRVMQASGNALNALVKEGTADLGIQVEHLIDTTLGQVELFSDDPVLVVSASHPAAASLRTYRDLGDCGVVSFTKTHNFRARVERWAQDVGITLNTVLESDNLDIIKDWIAKQLGVGFLPYFCVADELVSGQMRMIHTDPAPQAARMKVIFPSETISRPVVHSFLSIAREVADELHAFYPGSRAAAV